MALTLTFIHPALEVSVMDAQATSTYVQPTVGVAAVLMAVSAYTNARPMNFEYFDAVNATDLATIAVGKALADAGAAADAALQLIVGKALQDTAAGSDVMSRVAQFYRTFADSATSTASASIRMTDYADLTYFEADYVGTSITF
ncbi:hypothetical protein [Massilia sp. TSP1-1-2]|uniref:hypothetical protein n=1 Tax=Massilia sp. TSP1-1-2 TaxID=2804649 RepID=UPI003CEFAD8B